MPMPNWPSSKAMLSLQPSSAHFVAWYIELNGTVIRPPIEVVLMNSPARFRAKVGDERLRGADRSHQVGVDHPEDLLVGQPFERPRHAVAGVVEDHVDAAEPRRLSPPRARSAPGR